MRSAFVVGAGKFADLSFPALPYALNDASEFHTVITDPKRGDAPTGSVLLLNPKKAELIRELARFLRALKAQDEFVIYFAGHGRRLASGQWSFVCNDSNPKSAALTTFAYSDLKRLICAIDRRRGILIFDTCFARSAGTVLRGLRERGEFADVQPEPPHEGIVTIWACGASELTFEKDGHGLFSAWLLKAIKNGADVGVETEFLRAADVVSWIRAQLAAASMAEPLWPSFRAAGDTSGLYISRNPEYNKDIVRGSSRDRLKLDLADVTRRLVHDLGLQKKDRSHASIAKELGELAQTYFEGSKIPQGTTVLPGSRLRSLWWLVVTVVGSFVFGCISAALWENVTFNFCVAALFLVLLQVASKDAWRIIGRGSRSYFFLVNEWGFLHAKIFEQQFRWIAIPWTMLIGIKEKRERASKKLIFQILFPTSYKSFVSPGTDPSDFGLNAFAGTLTFSNADVLSRGGFEALRKAIDLGRRALDRQDLAPAPNFPEPRMSQKSKAKLLGPNKLVEFMLVGISQYGHLPELKAPPSDVDKLSSVFDRSETAAITKVFDKDLEGFEQALAAHFVRASGNIGLMYFTGHGALRNGEFYLALSSTDPKVLEETAFPVARFAELFLEFRLRHFVLILDCCLSGDAGQNLALTPLAIKSFEEFSTKEKEGISLLAATSPSENAYEFETGAVFTSALICAANELHQASAGPVTLGGLSQALTRYLADSDLPQHHNVFLGQSGASIILIPERSRPAEADLRKMLASELTELEKEQISNLSAAAKTWRGKRRRGMHRLIVSGATVVATTPGPSRIYYGCMALVGTPFSAVLFKASFDEVKEQWSSKPFGNFIDSMVFFFFLGLAILAGLFVAATILMLGNALWPWRKDQFVLLHPSGIISSDGMTIPASAITGAYRSTSDTNLTRDVCINVTTRDGKDRTVISSNLYRETNLPEFFSKLQGYVVFYRSTYNSQAWNSLLETLNEHFSPVD